MKMKLKLGQLLSLLVGISLIGVIGILIFNSNDISTTDRPTSRQNDLQSQSASIKPVPTTPSCPEGQEWNSEANRCEDILIHCPEGQVWNPITLQCEDIYTDPCQGNEVWNPVTQQCELLFHCEDGTQWNEETRQCEDICPAGQEWNSQLGECQTRCPDGQYLDRTLNRCVDISLKP